MNKPHEIKTQPPDKPSNRDKHSRAKELFQTVVLLFDGLRFLPILWKESKEEE